MATFEIPLPSDLPFFTFRTVLSEREYVFRFHWNQRSNFFSFDVSDEAGSKIQSGARFVIGYPLNLLWTDERAPRGTLIAFDLTGRNEEATLETIGKQIRMYYLPNGEPT